MTNIFTYSYVEPTGETYYRQVIYTSKEDADHDMNSFVKLYCPTGTKFKYEFEIEGFSKITRID